ncbi:Disease resistance protein L6 [Linum grandiflorum]
MGDIGKTTIAKAVYDMIKYQFDKCCFLENLRHLLSKDDGIISLQNRVISGVLGHISPVNNASEGINIIRDRVCKYKVLIVFDDVDEKFEFDQVLGKLDNFSSESRFIVTTRDKRVLELLRDYKLYQVEEMHDDHSLQLLRKHAFKMDYPQDGYAM